MASELSHRRGDGFLKRGGAEDYESADDGPHEHGARLANRLFIPLRRHEFEADQNKHNHNDDAADDFHEAEDIDQKLFERIGFEGIRELPASTTAGSPSLCLSSDGTAACLSSRRPSASLSAKKSLRCYDNRQKEYST